MITNPEHRLPCGSCRPDDGTPGNASISIITKSWADLSSSDDEGSGLTRVTRTLSGGPTKTLSDILKLGRTSSDTVATKLSADVSSDEDGLELSHTTRAPSGASTMIDPTSEDDGIPCSVATQRSLNIIPTEFDETQMVLKNTFLHVSDEVDEEMPKDIRRVQSCPDHLDCSLISLHQSGSQLLALKSSWQYLRVRCELVEKSSRARLALASLKERRCLPKRMRYKKKPEEILGIEHERGGSQTLEDAQQSINSEKASKLDGRRRSERSVIRAHGLVSNALGQASEDTEMDFGTKRDPLVGIQSSVADGRHDVSSKLGICMSASGLENEECLLYLDGRFSQHNKACHMPPFEDAKVSGRTELPKELMCSTARDNETQSAQDYLVTTLERRADGMSVDKPTSSALRSKSVISNGDALPLVEKLDELCDSDDGKREHFKATKVSSRLGRDASSKYAQITKKHPPSKMKQSQRRQGPRAGTHTSCKPAQFSLRKVFEVVAEKTGPFTILCFLIVFIIILGKIGAETNSQAQPKGCFQGEIPSFVTVTSAPREPDVMDVIPTVTLYAPCLMDSFEKIAAHYTASASAWNYVKSQGSPKIEVRKYREEPAVMWKKVSKVSAIEDFLMDAMLPKVGKLTEFTSQFYGHLGERQEGLIIGLFEPDLEEEAVNDKYRPMMAEVASAMQGKYHVTYMNTKKDHVWVQSEFGAVSFPAIAICEKYPGKIVLYTGEMSVQAVLQFVRELGRCKRRNGRDQMRALMGHTESQNEVCEASPVLRP